ncbi:MAG: CDP-diacylglycerol--serine O-phosphatidyltransferase [Candidatus Firestonebacteria bacterium]
MKKQFSIIPNLITSGNLVCGFLAIIFAVTDALKLTSYNDFINPFVLSSWLVLAAMIFDLLDGIVARMTKTDSQFGKELDSLADLTSFGIAPGVILYLSVLRHLGKIGVLIAAVYAVCAALRLARFNTIVKQDLKNFTGLPTPGAAGVLVSYVLFAQWGEWYYVNQPQTQFLTTINWYAVAVTKFNVYFLPVLMVAAAFLMVSNIKFFSLKQYVKKERAPFILVVMVAVTGLVFLLRPEPMFFTVTLGYIVFSLCRASYLTLRGVGKKVQEKHLKRNT